MSQSIKTKLNGLFKSHLDATKTICDVTSTEITTKEPFKYFIFNVNDCKINISSGCRQLNLNSCKNITIVTERLPITGLYLTRTNNIKINIKGDDNGSGYLSIDKSVNGNIDSEQCCMVDVNNCISIKLNGKNISDRYVDSTWTC